MQIFGIHDLGKSKYVSLGRKMWKHEEVSVQTLDSFRNEIEREGIAVEVIRI